MSEAALPAWRVRKGRPRKCSPRRYMECPRRLGAYNPDLGVMDDLVYLAIAADGPVQLFAIRKLLDLAGPGVPV